MKVKLPSLTLTCFSYFISHMVQMKAKVKEGHLTDFSVGYVVNEYTYIAKDKQQEVEGRLYEGPLKVSTKWTVKELSICPIGADEMAKVRAFDAQTKEGKDMEDVKVVETTKIDATEVAKAERDRILEIRSMCEQAGMSELADQYIKDGSEVGEVRKVLLDNLIRKQSEIPTVRVVVTESAFERFRSAAIDALLLRSGRSVDKPAPGADELRGCTLRELARECLRVSNLSTAGTPVEMVGRALSTSDFPSVLANVANKFLFEGYETAEETWRTWCDTGSVADFKVNTLVRPSEADDLDELPEGAEYRYGRMTDAKEEYRVVTFGKLLAITRQAIINDDLNALTDAFFLQGEAASRALGDIAYAVLTANAAMGDGVALFHANHANTVSAGVPSETTMAAAIRAMKLQKDIGGRRRLNIRPQFVICPVTLEGTAETFFNSTMFAGDTKDATRNNIYSGTRYTRVYEPRLDDSSQSIWYLAGPKGKTVKLFFLNGVQTPYLETKQGWSVDGVEYKVRIDAGAKAVDWRGLVRVG